MPGRKNVEKKAKIRIAHVVQSLDVGGLENGVVNLINQMDPSIFDHVILCLNRSGEMGKKIERKDVPIFQLGKDKADYLLPIKLARLFRRILPDIVHTRNWSAVDGIIGARLSGVPIVIHGEHGREASDPDGTNIKRNLLRKSLSPFVNQYITVSSSLLKWLKDVVGIPSRKITLIPNGVDMSKFNNIYKDDTGCRIGDTRRGLTIGSVGRLDPVKDFQTLIKSFAQLTRRYPHIRLELVGDGSCRASLEKLVKELRIQDQTTFWGWRTDPAHILKGFDVFVLPSIAEGMSNTILEAMATGLPVVATAVGGNPEMVVDHETGFLVPAQSSDRLAEAIECYIVNSDLAKRHGDAGRRLAEEHFSLQRMVAGYEEIYLQLAMNHAQS